MPEALIKVVIKVETVVLPLDPVTAMIGLAQKRRKRERSVSSRLEVFR